MNTKEYKWNKKLRNIWILSNKAVHARKEVIKYYLGQYYILVQVYIDVYIISKPFKEFRHVNFIRFILNLYSVYTDYVCHSLFGLIREFLYISMRMVYALHFAFIIVFLSCYYLSIFMCRRTREYSHLNCSQKYRYRYINVFEKDHW